MVSLIVCMRCLCGCPEEAIQPGFLRFMKISDGFSLPTDAELVASPELTYPVTASLRTYVQQNAGGVIWLGLRRYLLDEGS